MSAGNLGTVQQMMRYEKRFAFLKENIPFQSFHFHNYVVISYQYFRADDESNGFKYLGKANDLLEKYGKKLKMQEAGFGMAYAEAGAHYYRERKYTKAKAIIEKGLEIMPDHLELKVRLDIVLDELRN
ncbi:hypothetical protein [Xanthovirga aplysinae]|uniref:hypothetical protein n=1 Tax=Xanthovirga aplysinae TaxID=2529853 RepID=UPI0012BCA24C|nr:hypothetical protein [Xanthovirga aplysinae]MTI29859.1 hypothetical protein [Xanthovirga aplysinae]